MLAFILSYLRTKSRRAHYVLAALTLSFLGSAAQAAVIHYTVNAAGPGAWEYRYVVQADPAEAPIANFTIFFDHSLYANLALVSAPADWDALVISPDVAIPADGFYDALALGPFIGATPVGEFVVAFDFLGAGRPGAQRFDIVDPATYQAISRGITIDADDVALPEPGAVALTGAAVLLLARQRRAPRRAAAVRSMCLQGA